MTNLPTGWHMTANGGKDWVVFQVNKPLGYFRVFTAQNYKEAIKIALEIIKIYENVN